MGELYFQAQHVLRTNLYVTDDKRALTRVFAK